MEDLRKILEDGGTAEAYTVAAEEIEIVHISPKDMLNIDTVEYIWSVQDGTPFEGDINNVDFNIVGNYL